jgi:hypothetical protein
MNESHEKSTIHSVIYWVSVADKLPELEENVLIVCKDGSVGWAMLAECPVYERSQKTGAYERTDKKQIEWGQEENGFEYWNKIVDVILWAKFPQPPYVL